MVESFTVGRDREFDLILARYDVLGSLAHCKMLEKVGLLNTSEKAQLQEGLLQILEDIDKGLFVIAEGVEDVHSQIELLLTQRYGDTGKKIHMGRSRNDQVLVDLRLFFRAELELIAHKCRDLFQTLIQLSEENKEILMPGYTHMQVAMVSSFGLWFSAYAESLTDDVRLLQSVYQIINQNPLGSAAGYGSSFPLDRGMTTELLGFKDLCFNSIHAQMGRGKTELLISFAFSAIAHTLGKLAMDVCMFINQNFDFIKLPDAFTTGSSIMPHKKNPDVFELIRGRCNKLMALPQEMSLLTAGLPHGYHRDFQLLKEAIFPAIEDLKSCLDISKHALRQIEVNPEILDDDKYKYLYSVEEVNKEVLKGLPFRDAYQKIGQQIAEDKFDPSKEVVHTHAGSIGQLCLDEIQFKMNSAFEGFQFDLVNASMTRLLES